MEPAMTLTNKEKLLLGFLRELGWGEVKLLVQNGEPVLIYESIKSVRLEDEGTADQPESPARAQRRCSTIELFK